MCQLKLYYINTLVQDLCYTGTYADLTAFYLEMAVRAKAIADKIKYGDTATDPDPDPEPPTPPAVDKILSSFVRFLPENAAKALAWVVKYLFFGWLWGQWL